MNRSAWISGSFPRWVPDKFEWVDFNGGSKCGIGDYALSVYPYTTGIWRFRLTGFTRNIHQSTGMYGTKMLAKKDAELYFARYWNE